MKFSINLEIDLFKSRHFENQLIVAQRDNKKSSNIKSKDIFDDKIDVSKNELDIIINTNQINENENIMMIYSIMISYILLML